MFSKYQKELNIIKAKLKTIDFYLEEDSDYKATFGNGTIWKIDINGKWYDDYYITIRNEAFYDIKIGKMGFPLWILMKMFGVNPINKTTDEKIDFLIEYKDQIFDEKFQYKKMYKEFEENIKNKKE
ncbi:hypothetical protein PJV89_00560 [Aliarcobacter butzleri]|jgi:hypothetical protein|uniref:Uncharacterized protein n=1 Tax=Arcobacter lacus TaxID=1912876 RepID=A0ABX5JGX6_9BACT|nr:MULTISPECIES: hypothetical protein [Arcobacteraceae]MCT7909031.1 hypothetical protein [Arcobacter lacus]MCT7910383.1 hypothetical protein [Arcobacter lacus]MDN5076670.1 hypothetical protein [Aliarcobacter butzleri]MDN5117877.1 hypothetical protein [Aliarcobacter butzleri]PUE66377.1 hypothetical protein B0175_06605 [Arcobacter lacus]